MYHNCQHSAHFHLYWISSESRRIWIFFCEGSKSLSRWIHLHLRAALAAQSLPVSAHGDTRCPVFFSLRVALVGCCAFWTAPQSALKVDRDAALLQWRLSLWLPVCVFILWYHKLPFDLKGPSLHPFSDLYFKSFFQTVRLPGDDHANVTWKSSNRTIIWLKKRGQICFSAN